MPFGWLAGAVAASGVASAAASGVAGSEQASAENTAQQNSVNTFNKIQGNLAPYMALGQTGNNALTAALPGLTANFNPTQAQLAATPGYQFTLGQGLESTQNGFAAQGLGSSGSAMKGGAQYATGLASTTFNQQLQNYLAQNLQKYNMLTGLTGIGENAAAGTGNFGTQLNSQGNQALVGGATASAAGLVGATNALGSAGTGAAGTLYTNQLLQNSGFFGSNGSGLTTASANQISDPAWQASSLNSALNPSTAQGLNLSGALS